MQPEIGKVVEYTRTFSDQDVRQFATISQDDNPIHLNEEVAAASIFQQRVVHGMLTGAMFSRIFGTIYPGEGTIYLGQDLTFLKPVALDEPITARVELIAYRDDKRIGTFDTVCLNAAGKAVIKGQARVLFPPQ